MSGMPGALPLALSTLLSAGLAAGAFCAAPASALNAPPAATPASAPTSASPTAADSTRAEAPTLQVDVLHTGLDIPWEIQFINSTQYLLTERPARIWLGNIDPAIPLKRVAANLSDVWVSKEKGLLGMAVDPAFATNRTFYTCQSHRAASDFRVIRWRLAANGVGATRVGKPLIAGIPTGRMHAGCRVLVAPDKSVYVTTGDAADGLAPQTLTNLGGKILRVNRDGSIPATNPFAGRTGPIRYVWNWGHRNVQGLAVRPGTSQMFSAEHGPDMDDEVNRVLKASNYGWDPRFADGTPGYNQDVPMTDTIKFPNAVPAIWSSGFPTRATSGMEFVTGPQWGSYTGTLWVALLKDSGVMALSLTPTGTVAAVADVPELAGTHGRLRTIRRAPDGSLYVLTANGGGQDKVLRVTALG